MKMKIIWGKWKSMDDQELVMIMVCYTDQE